MKGTMKKQFRIIRESGYLGVWTDMENWSIEDMQKLEDYLNRNFDDWQLDFRTYVEE